MPSGDLDAGGSGAGDDPAAEAAARDWWPPPLSDEEAALRKRAGRLLESLRRIPHVNADRKAWENEHELVFTLFRRGCIDGASNGMLEAPIYNNRQIEDAWLFLLETRRRKPNRRKHTQECARVLGCSYNWSMVLYGSRKVRAALRECPADVRREVLEDAEALELIPAVMEAGEAPHCGQVEQGPALMEEPRLEAGATGSTPRRPAAGEDSVAASSANGYAPVLLEDGASPAVANGCGLARHPSAAWTGGGWPSGAAGAAWPQTGAGAASPMPPATPDAVPGDAASGWPQGEASWPTWDAMQRRRTAVGPPPRMNPFAPVETAGSGGASTPTPSAPSSPGRLRPGAAFAAAGQARPRAATAGEPQLPLAGRAATPVRGRLSAPFGGCDAAAAAAASAATSAASTAAGCGGAARQMAAEAVAKEAWKGVRQEANPFQGRQGSNPFDGARSQHSAMQLGTQLAGAIPRGAPLRAALGERSATRVGNC